MVMPDRCDAFLTNKAREDGAMLHEGEAGRASSNISSLGALYCTGSHSISLWACPQTQIGANQFWLSIVWEML